MKSPLVKLPLAINIFWHNANPEMFKFAKLLYSFYKRSTEDPLDRYLDIPVNFYPYVPASLDELELLSSNNTASIVLIDDHMSLDEDWNEFIQQLKTELSRLEGRHILLPVAITKNALELDGDVSDLNFIQLYSKEPERKVTFLLISLTHELCRRLYDMRPATMPDAEQPGSPIKLFLSHAKMDAKKLTESLRDHISKFIGLKSFFDAYDIPGGSRFASEIERQIKSSVLLVFHTDNYSSREWCRREILLAKQYNRPVLVVNQFQQGEYRSFPYIGNVPHVHYQLQKEEEEPDPAFFDFILLQTLRETLRFKFKTLTSIALARLFKVEENELLAYPPELITLLHLKQQSGIVIYPDPPLGQEELGILAFIRKDLEFVTPTLLPLVSKEESTYKRLSNLRVGIALSEVDQMPYVWIQNWAIQDLMVEITKYLLVGGARLTYSGRIDYGEEVKQTENELPTFNFARLLIDLVRNYRYTYDPALDQSIRPIDNYSFYPIYHLIPIEKRAELKKMMKFHHVPPPDYLNLDTPNEEAAVNLAKQISQLDSFDKKYAYAQSLTRMRETMIQKEDGRVVIGGKWIGFKGKMPGVLEETLLALEAGKAVYLIGGFGGVAKGIIEALQGAMPDQLSLPYYIQHYPDYAHFLQSYNENEWTDEEKCVDYEKIVQYLNEKGKANQEGYGLNNGLDRAENERLFHSRNEMEILALLLKGLQNIAPS